MRVKEPIRNQILPWMEFAYFAVQVGCHLTIWMIPLVLLTEMKALLWLTSRAIYIFEINSLIFRNLFLRCLVEQVWCESMAARPHNDTSRTLTNQIYWTAWKTDFVGAADPFIRTICAKEINFDVTSSARTHHQQLACLFLTILRHIFELNLHLHEVYVNHLRAVIVGAICSP